MSEIIRAPGPGNLPAGLSKGASRREAQRIMDKVRLDGLSIQGDAALTGMAMQLTVELNVERRQIVEQYPELTDLMNGFMVSFAVNATQAIRTRNSPFKGMF